MVHSDFIAVHRSTSADARLSQQLCTLRIFVNVAWVAMQKTSVGRCKTIEVWTHHERLACHWHFFTCYTLMIINQPIHTQICWWPQRKAHQISLHSQSVSWGYRSLSLPAQDALHCTPWLGVDLLLPVNKKQLLHGERYRKIGTMFTLIFSIRCLQYALFCWNLHLRCAFSTKY